MRYLYASGQCSNEDYSSGRVLYNMPGAVPFPVKLGCEVFERCRAALVKKGRSTLVDQVGGSSGVANNWLPKPPIPGMNISPVYISKLPKTVGCGNVAIKLTD